MRHSERPVFARSVHPLVLILRSLRRPLVAVALISAAVNVLMLTGSVFMLQVYDRVLASRSGATLVALCLIAALLYAFLGFFDFIRTRILSRGAHWLDEQLGPSLFQGWMARAATGATEAARPLGDLAQVRQGFASQGLLALFDLPWVPFYLGILFLIHWQLGLLAMCGAGLVLALAFANYWASRAVLAQAAAMEADEARFLEQIQRNADTVVPLGMLAAAQEHWRGLHAASLANAQRGTEAGEAYSALSKTLRMMLQSAILGLGAWLAIQQRISPGMIIAATIIGSRVLAPIDQIIAQWRTLGRAREAYRRLHAYIESMPPPEKRLSLPAPQGHLQVRNVTRFAPDSAPGTVSRRVLLHQVSFDLAPGDALGVIGPSASGKSVLARVLVGAWSVDGGSVRLDGAALPQWEPGELGSHVGYLPQTVELLAGTLQQNIARFNPDASDEDVIAAARMAGVHDMILRLPDGYATRIGYGGPGLSGGQAQRIALARALFRRPALVVLDEPNSNLDAEGDQALADAIQQMRALGRVVVVMAHRPSAIAAVNKLLMLQNGAVADFGDKEAVLRRVTRQPGLEPTS